MTISRWIGFICQPSILSSAASQSSKPGIVGGFPLRPKSNTDGTSGVSKWCIQIWLIAIRAVSGLSGWVIQRASARRRPVLVAG